MMTQPVWTVLCMLLALNAPQSTGGTPRPTVSSRPALPYSPSRAKPLPHHLSRLVRDFRIQTYHAYRTDRPELERSRAAWDQRVARWHAGGAKTEELPELETWLHDAIRQAVAAMDRPHWDIEQRPTGAHSSRVEPRRLLTPAASSSAEQDESDVSVVAPIELPVVIELSRRLLAPLTEARSEYGNTRETKRSSPTEASSLLQTTVNRTPRDQPELETIEMFPHSSRRTAAPLDTGLAPESDLRLEVELFRTDEQQPGANSQSTSDVESADVNTIELEARVMGYNRTVEMLEYQLLEEHPRSAEELLTLLKELEALVKLREDIRLYVDLSTDPQDAARFSIADIGFLVNQLGRRIAEAGERAGEGGQHDFEALEQRLKALRPR